MVNNNDSNQFDRSNLFTNSDQSSGDATHEYELELICDSSTMIELIKPPPQQPLRPKSQDKLGLSERALSAAGAAFLSAIIVNPLDVVKTRLQAQAAGVAYSHPMTNLTSRMAVFGPNMMFADLRCSPSCTRAGIHGTVSICPPDCFEYKGTLDVFGKIIRQEGVARLWRGTNAGLALAIPTSHLCLIILLSVKRLQHYLSSIRSEIRLQTSASPKKQTPPKSLDDVGIYLPCYDIFRNWFEEFAAQNAPSMTPYAPLLAGSLSRSLACTTCYPIELARTRMQAFKDFHSGKKAPGVWKTLLDVLSNVPRSENTKNNVQNYRALWTGLGAQLARDVPFSAICWSTLEPVRRRLLSLVGEEANAASVLGANFSAGFVAGSLAAAATCPLDVAKTRRQIERDPARALRMTTRQTLMEVWRDGGMKGLFTGVGPRVGRAGPSVGIVVSFYEVVKYALHHQRVTTS